MTTLPAMRLRGCGPHESDPRNQALTYSLGAYGLIRSVECGPSVVSTLPKMSERTQGPNLPKGTNRGKGNAPRRDDGSKISEGTPLETYIRRCPDGTELSEVIEAYHEQADLDKLGWSR